MAARIWFSLTFVLAAALLSIVWDWDAGWAIALMAGTTTVDATLRVRRGWREAPQASALLDTTVIFAAMSLARVPDSAIGIPFAYVLLAALVMLTRPWAIVTVLYASLWFTLVVRDLFLQGNLLSTGRLITTGVVLDVVFTGAFVMILSIVFRLLNRDAERRTHRVRLQEAIARASTLLLDESTDDPIEAALTTLLEGTDATAVFLDRNVHDEQLGLCAELQVAVCREGVEAEPAGRWRRVPWTGLRGREALERGGFHQVQLSEMSPSERSRYENSGVRSELILPVFVQGEWWGVIGFTNLYEERPWARHDQQMLSTAAGLFAAFLERTATSDELGETVSRLDLEVLYGKALAKSAEILATSDDERAPQRALRALLEATEADYAYIDENFLEPHQGLSARMIHEAERPGARPDPADPELWFEGSLSELPTAYAALRQGQPVSIRTSELSGREREIYEADGLLSELRIPINIGTEWRGSVGFADFVEARDWSDREIEALETAARMLGTFWERRESRHVLERLVESQQLRLEYEEAIAECSKALLASVDDSAIDTALRRLLDATGAHNVFVDRNEVVPGRGLAAIAKHEAIRPGFEQIVDEEIWLDTATGEMRHASVFYDDLPSLRHMLERGRPSVVYPRLLPAAERHVYGEDACKSELNIPIFQRGDWVGSIGFSDFLEERPWDQQEVTLLQTVAEMIGSFWERNAATRRLEELVRSKDEFVASVSHELRTPLAGVLGLSSELHDRFDDFGPDEVASFIEIISEQSADVAGIVDDLLVSARADIDMVTIDAKEIELRAIAEGTLDARLGAKFDDVEIRGPAVDVWADPGRLRQIVRNLVVNAARYGGSRVVVSTGHAPAFGLISVADDGGGVAPDQVDQIFEPYGRAHENRTQPGSVGLGLSVARQLATLMGGDLVYRRDDGWTVFEVRLPRAGGLRAVG